jgi:hypothetical protein
MMTPEEKAIVRQAAEILGRQKSDARAAASRENGRKGGRPPKLAEALEEQPEPIGGYCDEAMEGGRR